jgi:hypothetical protein
MLSSAKTPCAHQEQLQLDLTETGIPKSKHHGERVGGVHQARGDHAVLHHGFGGVVPDRWDRHAPLDGLLG